MWKVSTLASDIREDVVIDGVWRAAGEARATAARLVLDTTGIARIRPESGAPELAGAPFSTLAVSDRVGSIPRRLGFPDGSHFETRDNDAVDRILRMYRGSSSGLIHELERFRPRLLVFVAVVIGLAIAIYRFAVPALVELAVIATPPVVPQLMSRSVLLSLDRTVFEPTGLPADRQKLLTEEFGTLVAAAPRDRDAAGDPDFTLNFRKGGAIGPNAFALPDGTVIVTDELIELAGKDDELVLGVLAHEIGHVERQHSLRQLYRAAGVTALVLLIGGDVGSGAEDILVQGSALLSLSYSRGAETEADRFSVDLMYKAGRDPRAIARFFELLRDKLGDDDERDFLSTHPATPERIAETLRYADQVIAAGRRDAAAPE